MISICIPVYNFNVAPLVTALSSQASLAAAPIEILLIDDASKLQFKNLNRSVCEKHTYIELEQNVGRAKIRNLFLQYAAHPYLLFLDCDALIISPDFLSNYIDCISNNPSVVCGGRVYDTKRPTRDHMLRWKYGIFRESQPSAIRAKQPNKSFMTNNFLIKKGILEKIKFDERLTQYGHEDTLFGYALKKENITILHIENPVLNGDVETNTEFLRKTDEGLKNLAGIIRYFNSEPGLMKDVTLLRTYVAVKSFRGYIYFIFLLKKPVILFLLRRGYVNLYLFDFYKLGRFIQYSRTASNT